ncbi:MAG: adenosylcobinamide-GDP ribazoletransferase [Sulfitobacter sp.]
MNNPEFLRRCLGDVHVATSLLSRLPVPHLVPARFDHSARAVWAYPVAGLILALISMAFAVILMWFSLPFGIAAGGLIGAMMITTGAMHEDGLADTCDGFWGGWDKSRRLEIMKDSHIGTYGVLSLLVVTGLRWTACTALLATAPLAIVVAAILSRSVMPGVMAALPHARDTGLSKSVGRPTARVAGAGFAIAAAIAVALLGGAGFFAAGLAVLAAAATTALAKAKIDGQTGDVLGATQQLSEVVILLGLVAVAA